MKKWPEELNDVQPTEELISSTSIRLTCKTKVTVQQREILRKFLFDLGLREKFTYFYKEIDREFECTLGFASFEECSYDSKDEMMYSLELKIDSNS